MKDFLQLFFFSLILLFTASRVVYAQEKIENPHFESRDGKIFIYYTLVGDPDQEYEIHVTLRRTSVPSFSLIPSVLEGTRGKLAGGERTIIWQINTKEEAILDGEDFYFDLEAEEIGGGGGIPWYVYAGGAAVAGGAAAFLLLKKKDETGNGGADLPTPPLRPQ
jgi:hypothetical protein